MSKKKLRTIIPSIGSKFHAFAYSVASKVVSQIIASFRPLRSARLQARMAADPSSGAPPKRKCGFVWSPVKQKSPKIPRAVTLNVSDAPVPVPHDVSDRLGNPSCIVGFDCETHDWRNDATRKGRVGPFGWYTVNDDVPLARIVRLGWAVGDASVETGGQSLGETIGRGADEREQLHVSKAATEGL